MLLNIREDILAKILGLSLLEDFEAVFAKIDL